MAYSMVEAPDGITDLVGKIAMWKIRVYGPAKFAERSGEISHITGLTAFTKEGHALRLIDMVDTPDEVGGGGMWAVVDAPSACHGFRRHEPLTASTVAGAVNLLEAVNASKPTNREA